jgi:hypothetical protein
MPQKASSASASWWRRARSCASVSSASIYMDWHEGPQAQQP